MKVKKSKLTRKRGKSKQLKFEFEFGEAHQEMRQIPGKRGRYFTDEVYRELCAMVFLS